MEHEIHTCAIPNYIFRSFFDAHQQQKSHSPGPFSVTIRPGLQILNVSTFTVVLFVFRACVIRKSWLDEINVLTE